MNPQNIFSVLPNYTPTIGVMGSASGYLMRNEKAVKAAYDLGTAIAENGCTLVNGACPGLPDKAAEGCKDSDGETIGVSPAISLCSHMGKYKSPVAHYDRFIFTGMGLMMRDIVNIRTSDAVVILPGGTGTLNEFTVAYDEGKPIGVLTGYDGCADHIKEILKFCHRDVTDLMVFDSDPKKLIEKLLDVLHTANQSCNIDDYLVGDGGEVTKADKEFESAA